MHNKQAIAFSLIDGAARCYVLADQYRDRRYSEMLLLSKQLYEAAHFGLADTQPQRNGYYAAFECRIVHHRAALAAQQAKE